MWPATLVSCCDSITVRTISSRTQSRFFRYSNSPLISGTPSLIFRSFGACFSDAASFLACSYAASFSPFSLISSRNSSDHFLVGSDANLTEEQMNDRSCRPGSPKWFCRKTVVIGWLSTPPFSGRYSERLDNASVLPFFVPGR